MLQRPGPKLLEPVALALAAWPLLTLTLTHHLEPLVLFAPPVMGTYALIGTRGVRAGDLGAMAAMSALAGFAAVAGSVALVVCGLGPRAVTPFVIFVHLLVSYAFGIVGFASFDGRIGRPPGARAFDVLAAVSFAAAALLYYVTRQLAVPYVLGGLVLAARIGWSRPREQLRFADSLWLLAAAAPVLACVRLGWTWPLAAASLALALVRAVAAVLGWLHVRQAVPGRVVGVGPYGVVIRVGEELLVSELDAQPGDDVTVLGRSRELPQGGPFRASRPVLEAREAWPCDRRALTWGALARAVAWLLWAGATTFALLR